MNRTFQNIAKESFQSLIASAEEDARHFELKAKDARKSVAMLKKLQPEIIKMLEPPKPFKVPKMTKKRLAEIRRKCPSYPVD